MKQRQRKMAISDRLTWWLGRVVGFGLALILVVGLPMYGLWRLAENFEYITLRWIAAALTLSLIPAFISGFYAGRLETRGFLGGMDAAMERLSRAVNLRDTSRITVHRETRSASAKAQPNYNILLPQVPSSRGLTTITHRQLANEEVVDL